MIFVGRSLFWQVFLYLQRVSWNFIGTVFLDEIDNPFNAFKVLEGKFRIKQSDFGIDAKETILFKFIDEHLGCALSSSIDCSEYNGIKALHAYFKDEIAIFGGFIQKFIRYAFGKYKREN